MNFKKIVYYLLIILLLINIFVSCKKEKQTEQFAPVVHGAVLNGPSGIGLVHLFEEKPAVEGDSTMEVCATPDVLLPKMLKGEIDIGILPPNVAAKIFNKNNGEIVCAGVIGWGMLNLVTKDTTIKTVKDLQGKTIYSAGFGSTPEYILRYILENNGMKIGEEKEDTKLDFSISNAEIPAALISGKVEYAFVPEPFATVAQIKDQGIVRAFDVQSIYKEISGYDSYPMTMVVVRKEFAQKYPATVKMYLQSCAQSVGLVNKNPVEAGVLVEKHGLGLQAQIVNKVIPNASFAFKTAQEAKSEIENFFKVLMNFAPESIGGVLPSDDFYFNF